MKNIVHELVGSLELSDVEFLEKAQDLKEALKKDASIVETSSDLETLPAIAQYWLAQKADLEFHKRGIEREMRRVAGPTLVKAAKNTSYVSNRIVEIALQDNEEYAKLNDKLSRLIYITDLIASITTSLWFKRDGLVNLAIAQRKQLAYEQHDW